MITADFDEICFGGARGGGKTDAVLGEWAIHQAEYGANAKGIVFRREFTQLFDMIERSHQLYPKLGAKYTASPNHMWRFPNGAVLRFAHLDRDQDADKYQGHNYTRVYIEEIGTFPDEKPINKLKATLRSATGVPCRFICTCNPGGVGHNWVKERYITPAPPFTPIEEPFVNPFTGETIIKTRIFIPSNVTDNPYLGTDYIANLQQAGSENLVKAWLMGDWDIVDGAFFDSWHGRNVIMPFKVPDDWIKFTSMDWGYAKPFSVGWWAVVGDDCWVHGRFLPRGALVRYREWYGVSRKKLHGVPENDWPVEPNVGVRLTPRKIAEGIRVLEGDEKIAYRVLDPACFASQNGGLTIAEELAAAPYNVICRPADNTRVGKMGSVSGWSHVRARIVGDADDGGYPMLYVFKTCTQFLRTIPVLQHDPDRPEDVDTDQEDHIADETRYACASRPWVGQRAAKAKPEQQVYVTQDGGRTTQSVLSIREVIERKGRRELR